MKENRNGISIIILIIIIVILAVIAGITIMRAISGNGVVSTAFKMEEETASGEVRDHFLKLLNEELVSASADIQGTTEDIGSRYNEPTLINFLKGNSNYSEESGHKEANVTCCIEEFDPKYDTENEIVKIENLKGGEGEVKSKYRVISENLCTDGDKYGLGKNVKDGNIFTLEAVNPNTENYNGEFELVYYDKNNKRTVLEKISLYLTKQS